MSGIVLSASVRQNLLSLQSTASLLAKTQNDLATGNKVNSALDNPTNFFTAQGLNNRASEISNLLDGIGNGVQVLQAANTGITSLQSLVSSAKSIANQVLQSPVGYSTKSNVTSAALTGATATNLLAASTTAVTGTAVLNDNTGTAAAITGSTLLSGTAGTSSNDLGTAITTGDTLVVNGTTFTFVAGTTTTCTSIGIGDTVTHLLSAINTASGGSSSITAGAITVTPGSAGLTLSGSALAKLGLSATGDGLAGQTLTIGATGGGTATSITFGLGTGQVSTLNAAATTLRSEASALGSNLSIVQIRQDFNKNLINVLQTGSSNLTLADTNEEAANSQALSTRQSIAVSALALANQSQASVLQLLR